MKRSTMLEAWTGYRRKVIPISAGPAQVTETRRAFYAGAQALMGEIMAGLDPGPDATASDLEFLADISRELEVFGRDVLEGRA